MCREDVLGKDVEEGILGRAWGKGVGQGRGARAWGEGVKEGME